MIPFQHGLILSTILFILGIIIIFTRRNFLFMLIGIEIMLNAAALVFILSGYTWKRIDSQIMYILTITIAAIEASIGLALLLKLHRYYHNLKIDLVRNKHG
ncbi:MAG: NADH-quinone oxidoreductase subunit NuoK [Candidatus Dasytiphilus stammeri]